MLKDNMYLGIKAYQNNRDQKGREGPEQVNPKPSFRKRRKHSHHTRV